MYIGHISDTSVDALTGVGVTFPILLMVTAFANLFGSGGTPLFSMARGAAQQGGEEGEKQRERAADVMNTEQVINFTIRYRADIKPGMWVRFRGEKWDISTLGEYSFKRTYLGLKASIAKGVSG